MLGWLWASRNSSRSCSVCSDCQPSPGSSGGKSRRSLSSVVVVFASIVVRNSAVTEIFQTNVWKHRNHIRCSDPREAFCGHTLTGAIPLRWPPNNQVNRPPPPKFAGKKAVPAGVQLNAWLGGFAEGARASCSRKTEAIRQSRLLPRRPRPVH